MEHFEFDYNKNMKERLDSVEEYFDKIGIDEFTTIDNSGLNEIYLESIGNFILYADNKEKLKENKESINESQRRVLIDHEKGLKTYVNQRHAPKIKCDNRSSESEKRILKNIDTVMLIDDNIKAYDELLEKCHNKRQKEEVYKDKTDCKNGLKLSEVHVKAGMTVKYDTMENFNVEYNEENIKIMLKCFSELYHAEPFTDKNCMYLDLMDSLKYNLTEKQLEVIFDMINNGGVNAGDNKTLNYSIKKIKKYLN